MNSNVFSYIYIYIYICIYIYININININIYRETSTVYCPGELDGWTSAAILAVLVFPWSYMSGRLFTICTLAATIGSPPAVGSGAD